jgi:hypothetical protein
MDLYLLKCKQLIFEWKFLTKCESAKIENVPTSIPFKGIVANVLLLNVWKILKETYVYKYLTLQFACETTVADSAWGTGHPPPPNNAIDAFESRESRSETGPNWLITSNS